MTTPSESTMRLVAANLIAFTLDAVDAPRDSVVVSDEDLEYWGRFYMANRFAARGVLFETFMTDPFAISQAVLFGGRLRDPDDFLPLLPRQREVAREMHPHVQAISKPLPPLPDECYGSDALDIPIFLRKQAD